MNDNDYYNNRRGGDLPFFEDTHRTPDYGRDGLRDGASQNTKNQPSPYGGGLYPQNGRSGEFSGQSLGHADYVTKSTKNFNNLMVYKPMSETDSKTIIDFVRRGEPAIIDLEKAEVQVSQRILDFVSGAVYALSGTVHRVSGNIFLLSPKGVEVTVPYEVEDER